MNPEPKSVPEPVVAPPESTVKLGEAVAEPAAASGANSPGEITGASPWAKRKGRHRSKRPRSPVERDERPVDQQQVEAQARYDSIMRAMDGVIYSTATERPADEGDDMVELEEEEQSYYVMVRGVAQNVLGFEYPHDKRHWRDGHLERQRPNKRGSQDQEAHQNARRILGIMVDARFKADQERITQLTTLGSTDEALAAKKVQFKGKGKPRPLSNKLEYSAKKGKQELDELRFHVIQDAVDWFAARVNQVESLVKRLTVRTATSGTIEERVAALDNNKALTAEVAQLEEDMTFLQSLTTLDVEGADAKDIASKKKSIEKQVGRAHGILDRFKRDRTALSQLVKIDEKMKVPQYAVQKKIVGFALKSREGTVTDSFFTECEKRLVGLDPEEERQFWAAMLEMFDEAVPKDGGINEDARARALVDKLHIFKVDRGTATLINVGDTTLIDEDALPANLGQLIERCKSNARQLAELRTKMKKTYAIMGPNFQKAVREGLKGNPNQAKLDMVDQLNSILSGAQRGAHSALARLPDLAKLQQKFDAMPNGTPDEQLARTMAHAVLVSAQAQHNAATEYRSKMAGREPQNLNFKDDADQGLIGQIRDRVITGLGLGTLGAINFPALVELMSPPVEKSDVLVTGTEDEPVPTVSVFERISSLSVAQELIDSDLLPGKTEATATDVFSHVDNLFRKFTDLVASAKLREALKLAADELVDDLVRPDQLTSYVRALENIVECSYEMKSEYGPKWAEAVGLVRQKQVNDTLLTEVCRTMKTGVNFLDALQLFERPETVTWLNTQIDPKTKAILSECGIVESDRVLLMLEAMSRGEPDVSTVPHGQAISRLANFLVAQRGPAELTGNNLLVTSGIMSMEGTDRVLNTDIIRPVIERKTE